MKVLNLQENRPFSAIELQLLKPRAIVIELDKRQASPELTLRPFLSPASLSQAAPPSKAVLLLLAGSVASVVLVGGYFGFIAYQKTQATTLIVAAGAEPDADGLLSAIAEGNTALLGAYRTLGFKVEKTPRVIEAALASGSPEVLRLILSSGAEKANEPNLATLLAKAAETDQGDLLKQLVAFGLDINGPQALDGKSLLQFAAIGKRWNAVKTIIELGGKVDDVDSRGNTIAHYLIESNDPDLFALLKEKGGELGRPNASGASPLLIAVAKDADKLTAFLVKSGVDPTAKTERLPSPLEHAMDRRNDAVLQSLAANSAAAATQLSADGGRTLMESKLVLTAASLIGNGIDPNGRFPDGLSTLALAIDTENTTLVKQLLEKGAKANDAITVNGISGVTPLLLATLSGNAEIAAALIQAGAATNVVSSNGLSARDIALQSGNAELSKLFSPAR